MTERGNPINSPPPSPGPRVVIVGAGFGGLNAAVQLRRAPVEVVVIDRRNYHLFQPLLYQVATGLLSPAQIATPIRHILSRQKNASVLMERVIGIDRVRREVVTDMSRVPFDYLIIATGARHHYFGHESWETIAPGLKKIDEATEIRARILTAFELAEAGDDDEQRRRLLTFAVIGAGPTGVEMAGAIAELARHAMTGDFRRIDPARARILLIEAGDRVLTSFPPELSEKAMRQLERLGVEVMLRNAVTACDEDGLTLSGGERIACSSIVWAAGVMASPAAKWLGETTDRAGRVPIGPDLALMDDPAIFVIGDTAAVTDAKGQVVPGVAPAAKQMGRYVAKVIRNRLAGRSTPAFVYRDWGNLATIGRKAAVADFGYIRLSGLLAWLAWSFAHIWFLIGFRNRLLVLVDWAWAYFTYDRGARLITGR
jgi:NADH:ubiquinone reductase (H+-translocating)